MKFSLLSCAVLAASVLSAPLAPRCDDGCRSLNILGGDIGSPQISDSGNPVFEGNGSPSADGSGNGNGNPVFEGNGNGNGNPVADGNGNPSDFGNGNGDGSANDNNPVAALGSILGLGETN